MPKYPIGLFILKVKLSIGNTIVEKSFGKIVSNFSRQFLLPLHFFFGHI
jgi:hypothetical protein